MAKKSKKLVTLEVASFANNAHDTYIKTREIRVLCIRAILGFALFLLYIILIGIIEGM